MSRFVARAVLGVCLLLCSLVVHAAYRWTDSGGKKWLSAELACARGEAVRQLNADRAAYPGSKFRIASAQVSYVDRPTEAMCQVVIDQWVVLWWVSNVTTTSIFQSGTPDVCPSVLPVDTTFGICGSPKADSSCSPNGCNGTDPIDHFTARVYQTQTDYTGTGQFGLRFVRYYSSRDPTGSALGAGWHHTYSRSLAILSDGVDGSVYALRDDGRILTFTLADGVVSQDADVSQRLTPVAQGGGAPPLWMFKDTDDATENYDGDGRLVSVVDRAGQTITPSYAANGQLVMVKDAFGRALTFSYDADGRLTGFTDPNNASTGYAYDASGHLATVTRPDSTTRRYLYNESAQTGAANLPDALTGLIDETGQRYASWTYDAQGRGTSSKLGGGANTQRMQLSYNADGSATITDPLGTARTYTLMTLLGVAYVQARSQPCDTCIAGTIRSQSYDANGNVGSYLDFDGNRTNQTFDSARNLVTSRTEGLTSGGAATGRTRTITTAWHPTWRLPQQVAEPLRITTYVYNGDTDNGVALACGAAGALCRVRQQATSDATGSSGLSAATTGTPRVWNYTYNALGQRLTQTGPRTDLVSKTTWTYDAATGNLTQVQDALGHLTQYTRYDGSGRPLSITDPNGVVTTLSYDYRGLLTSMLRDGRLTSLSYTAAGQPQQVTLPDGSYVRYAYDDAHRKTSATDNLGQTEVHTLDDAGNTIAERSLNSDGSVARRRSRAFNALGRLQQDIDALNNTTTYAYDTQGNLVSITDPRSTSTAPIVTTLAYDELNRRKSLTDANAPAGVATFGYDARDQLKSLAAPNGATTSYTTDGLGNPTQESGPDRGSVAMTYDAAGNLLTRTDARGVTATYTYDALNRLTSVSYPSAGENIAYTWDRVSSTDTSCTYGIGRLCQVVDAGGSTTYAYDARGNLVGRKRSELGVSYTAGYTYTDADRVATLSTPTGKTITASRDALGRVTGLSAQVAGTSQALTGAVAYNALGKVTRETAANGVTTTNTYDAAGRASANVAAQAGTPDADAPLPGWALALLGTLLLIPVMRARCTPAAGRWLVAIGLVLAGLAGQDRAYAFDTQLNYDAAGNLTQRVNATGTTTYTYDALGRLKSEAGPAKTQTFGYDADGNRTLDGAGSYTVAPASNRYATAHGATPTYDAAGDLTGGMATGTPTATRSFVFNQAGQLSQVLQGATVLATYTYDAEGRRTRKALSAQGAQRLGLAASPLTIVYHYDLRGNLLAETTAAGTPIRTYVWREAADEAGLDVPIAQIEHANNAAYGGSNATAQETVLYISSDLLGVPREARNAAGTIVWRWASDAFGTSLPNEDVAGSGKRSVVNLRFAGQYYDAESGLMYNWHRQYDPASGRYTQSDPIGIDGGTNTYAYVGGNPITAADPAGLQIVLPIYLPPAASTGSGYGQTGPYGLIPVYPSNLPSWARDPAQTPGDLFCVLNPLLCILNPNIPPAIDNVCTAASADTPREECKKECVAQYGRDTEECGAANAFWGKKGYQACMQRAGDYLGQCMKTCDGK